MAKYQPHRKGFPGEKYGRLEIIADVPISERRVQNKREVLCRCDCGNIVRVQAGNLFSCNTSSCGCFAKELITKRNVDKLLGQRFGRLVVIDYERDYLNPQRYRYICQCDCGNTHKVLASDLTHGLTHSCGCYRKEFNKKRHTDDLTGQTFNELTAIKQVDDFVGRGNYRRTKWLFRCSCGNEIEALAVNVKNGKTKSCGHFGKSIAEYNIRQWLNEHKIRYEYEASFDDLRNPLTQYKLKFDFKIYRPDGSFFILEHQGSQHYTDYDIDFGRQQREQTDELKKDYCKLHNIILYETVYNEDYIQKLKSIVEYECAISMDKLRVEELVG